VTEPRASKGQRRITAILRELPDAREQLVVAMEGFGVDFDEVEFIAASRSRDARERNRVAVVERQYEVLLNWLHELAARGLAEAQRLGMADKSPGSPWRRLAELGVISHESAERLQEAMEMRDALAHAYPPANWKTLHEGVLVLVDELDLYVVSYARWISEEGMLPPD
jgi:uncharacterized protein YutE (UPF0331/DUF86 family)